MGILWSSEGAVDRAPLRIRRKESGKNSSNNPSISVYRGTGKYGTVDLRSEGCGAAPYANDPSARLRPHSHTVRVTSLQ